MSALYKAVETAKREIRELLPVAVFFLVGFNLINFSKHLILAEVGIAFEGVASASIGALLIAKAVLLADLFQFMNRFEARPLYVSILYKSFLYTFFTAILRLLEVVVGAWIHLGELGAGVEKAVSDFVLPQFIFVLMWVFVLFLFYVTLAQLRDEVLGGVPIAKILVSRDKKRLLENSKAIFEK